MKGIAFDLEGTLVDVESAHWQGHILAAREVGLELTLDEAVARLPHFVGGPDRAIAEEICAAAGRGDPETVLQSTCAHYENLVRTLPVVARPYAYAFITGMFLRQIPIAIGSVTPRARAAPLMAGSGLDRYIPADCQVFLEDVARHKPAPDVFLETARRMEISPEEQVVFDDSPVGIEAAVAAGSTAIGIPTRHGIAQRLRDAGAYEVISEWDQAGSVLRRLGW